MDYLIHVGYVITLGAMLARDILLLRSLLIAAQSIVATYAFANGVLPIARWNALFCAINIVYVVLILRDRRAVTLSPELAPIYERRFTAMTPREFLRWWSSGRRETLHDHRLAAAGDRPDSLFFLVNGQVRVSRGGVAVADLPAGFFVAEMSLITGQPANADVDAVGAVEVIRWSAGDVRGLRERSPGLWTKIQSVLGYDLVEKIRRGDERLAAH